MRRCFLHIGTHKTGTKSLQTTLDSARESLTTRRFLYPATGIPPGSAGQHNIAWQLRGDSRFTSAFGTVEELLAEIDKSDHDVILSSEDFGCAVDSGLESFVGKLEQRCEVEIIIYVRDQVSYARSLYIEMLSHGCNRTFSEFFSEVIERREFRWRDWVFAFDYRALLSQLRRLSTVIVRHFDPGQSVISDFLSILKLSPSHLQIDPEYRTHRQQSINSALALFYKNCTGRQLEGAVGECIIREAVTSIFGDAEIDVELRGRQNLVSLFEELNHWTEAQFGIPRLMNRDRAVPQSLPTTRVYLEDVFSAATVRQIAELDASTNQADNPTTSTALSV
jgi:hypothetical protein